MNTRRLGGSPRDIEEAAAVIRAGGLAAFPTETVYGLGADCFNEAAVRQIYVVKGRPKDNPSICHIADTGDLGVLAARITPDMERLAEIFWPGPMTMIVPKTPGVPLVTTGGLETVGVRLPRNETARALIRAAGVPIAAPSANLSGRPSPTTADHVLSDLGGRIACVLDGGPCQVGIESTVIDMTGDQPMILRPGYLTKADFECALGKEVLLDPTLNIPPDPARGDFHPKAPGQKYKHYAPKAPMIIFDGSPDRVRAAIEEERSARAARGQLVKVIAFREDQEKDAARLFFAELRDADREGADVILAAALPQEGLGFSVMNRMLKSAGFNVRKV